MSSTNSKIQDLSVEKIVENLKAAGMPPDFGEDNSRLLIKTLKTLAQGEPIASSGVERISDELGISCRKG